MFGGAAPETVELKQTDFQEEQKKSVRGNTDALPDIQELVSKTNKFSQEQATDLIEQAVPGFNDLQERFMSLSSNMLDNAFDLPPEVTENIERFAAERGINVGGRGQFQDFSLTRDFGINSLEYGMARQRQALNTFQSIVAQSPRINPISPASFFVSPQEQAQMTFQQNQANQKIAQGAANAKAAAKNQRASNILSTVGTIAGVVAAPFTGGASLALTTAMAGGMGDGGASSGAGSSFYQDQSLNVNPNLFG